ncbi:MAG: RNA polymerase sigma-70 factor [Bacteroidia bacterium]
MDTPRSAHASDEHAFKALYEDCYPSIRNFLYYKSGNMDQAEDLTQDSFMILWKKWAHIDPEKVKSYLYTIATNLFLNEVKHDKVVMKFRKRPTRTTTEETPQYDMEEEEFKQRLEAAIAALPEKNRVVFLMNRIDKITYKEIADFLDISVKAVEKRMHKALLELRKLDPRI